MSRSPRVWFRKGRGFFTTLNGHQIPLGPDRHEAERAFHRLRLEPRAVAPSQYTIHDLVSLYLSAIQPKASPDTYRTYYKALMAWKKDRARLKPADMRAFHLEDWLEAHPTWNASTRSTHGGAIKTWSRYCDRRGYIDGDRLRSAKLPGYKKRAPAPAGEIERLMDAITEPYFRDYFIVLYDTGARPGEIASLEAAGVHWDESAATVRGKSGARVIGLTARALAILRDAEKRTVEGPLLVTSNSAVWSDPVRHSHITKWEEIAGTKHIVSYHLRHALWQRWHNAGVSDVVIARQLGHRRAGEPHLDLITSTYSHAHAVTLASAAQAAESAAAKARVAAPSKRQRLRG